MIHFPFDQSHLNYDTLAHDFLKTCQTTNTADQLKLIITSYRETPVTVDKTIRLITFIHHLLKTTHQFPLGTLLEELIPTLSLNTSSTSYPIWILITQFLISCLRSMDAQDIHHSGITTTIIHGIIKHILMELTRLPITSINSIQTQCFNAGKELMDIFLIHSVSDPFIENNPKIHSIGTTSFFDIIYSSPDIYGHFLNGVVAGSNEPSILNHSIWTLTMDYMVISTEQDTRLLDHIPTAMAINIIKHVLREINSLPPNLTTQQVNCLNKGKKLINILLLGPSGDGVGVVSHYDIIVALPDVYGNFMRGTFAQSIHWTMEKFVNELGKRRRHLAFLMMPPDASWPLISRMSRRHEYNDLTTRTSYHMFEGDLIEYVTEGSSTNIETHFRDMLFQRASMDEFRQLAISLTQTGLDTSQIRKAMVSKIRDVLLCIQHYSNNEKDTKRKKESFNAIPTATGEDIQMSIPSNIDLWELMTETADQLYSFVSADSLLFLSKVSTQVIQRDLKEDEKLFGKLVKLYNFEQTESIDAFSIRDLSLQCAINLMKSHIKDLINIKQRYPSIAASLQYAGLCYQIQAYFNSYYHSNVATNSTLFSNLNIQEMTKIAMESQLRQDVVPYTLYVYLVPTKTDVHVLGYPSCTYIKGGKLSYKLLDLLSVNGKHRLLQLIYKMMLDSEWGPRYQPNAANVVCVPPSVLDVVYKLIYSAPCSAELMIKEIFDKLRRCDKMVRVKHTEETQTDNEQLSDQTVRWFHSMVQLMNYRFIQFLKYSPISSGLLHHIRYSVSYLENRQAYQALESFVINIICMQNDVKLLRSLDDPQRDKPIWFAESEVLARMMVCTISRLFKTRGQADIKTEQIYRVLSTLYEYKLDWSPEVMKYFPQVVQSFYNSPDSPNQLAPTRISITPQKVQQVLSSNKGITGFLVHGRPEFERIAIPYFSILDNQSSLLCFLWAIALTRKTTDCFNMGAVRKALLLIPPSRMGTNTIDFVDFILMVDYPVGSSESYLSLLDTFIWKNQWVSFNHVLFALTRGNIRPDKLNKAMKYIRYLLLESPEFQQRVSKWDSLDINNRPWAEEDFHEKLMDYLREYPEYHCFEGYGMRQFEPVVELPNQPLRLPIYYTNNISDFIALMEHLIMRLIEYRQTQLLMDVLDKYGHLFHHHQNALSCITSILLYYHSSPVMTNPRVLKIILRLLDFDLFPVAPEAKEYAFNDDCDSSLFDAGYFERLIYKLAERLNPKRCSPRMNPNLPERHFREIGSPAVEGIYVATLEIMLTQVPASTIIKRLLDMTLLRESYHVGVSALSIHAIGLLIPLLPVDQFSEPLWKELNDLVMFNPYLLEVSEPCRLIRCGIPKSVNGKYSMSQSLPDLTSTAILNDSISARLRKAMIFPYIFNDYTFNLHNYSTNAPNSFLTLFHSIVHYSSLDVFEVFLENLKRLRNSGEIKTDVQLLYVCFLIGPAIHRIEKLDTIDAGFLIELMHMVKQVTQLIDMKDGWSTQALEQVYDFLYHIRSRFLKSPELTLQIKEIIKSMNPPISQRLMRLVMH
ncbi:hypothetical protein BDB01DRAFT_845071 [Pilobolus umbonatus]|nr:hypothetical protein BDB01DRAFT_845071 [Pilobolus umbonatus]